MLLSLPLVSFFPCSRRSAIPILVKSVEFLIHTEVEEVYMRN